jgi:transcriptional regulator with XRE-family HTH domain
MHPGAFIKEFRKRKGIKGAEMARLLEVDYWRLQKWEAGKTMPGYADMGKINRFFRVADGQEKTPADLEAAIETILVNEEGTEYRTQPRDMEAQLAEKDKRIKELEETVAALREALQTLRETKKKQ